MNLHNMAGPAVGAVNPPAPAVWKQSTGFTKDASFKQVPSYATPAPVLLQMQPLTYKDLMQVNGLNINGEKRAFYLNGDVLGVRRTDARGGDLFKLDADGSIWLVVLVLEHFVPTAGWGKVATVLQPAEVWP